VPTIEMRGRNVDYFERKKRQFVLSSHDHKNVDICEMTINSGHIPEKLCHI
jgi:hypothetical protein